MFISKKKLDKLIVETIREIVDYQFETFIAEPDDLNKLNQQKGAITSLLILRDKIEKKKTWL